MAVTATATATTSEKKCNCSSSTFTFSNFLGFIVFLMAAAKSTAATAFVKVKTLKTGSTAAIKSTVKVVESKPVFVKVETLKPGSTAATKSTVKVVESNPVKATGGGGGRGGRLLVNSRSLIGDETTLSSSLLVTNKMYAREPVPPFVSTEEMMKKFQSNIREMSLPPMSKRKHKLTLTRPKQPEFATAKRVRPTRFS